MSVDTDIETGLPIGSNVSGDAARQPIRTTIEGSDVRLEPLDAARHGAALFESCCQPQHARLWVYLFDGPYADYGSFHAALKEKAHSDDPLFFAIVNRASARAVGFAALMRIEPAHRVIEVGSIVYSPVLQRTRGATEAMYLMARHIFEDLGYRRYEWKCNALNAPSRRAAERFGFTFEGIFRQHLIIKGRSRDTAWFSMLDGEWPARKAAFVEWLRPENFDEHGMQRVPLSAAPRRG
jgi:RimJ/RimL family protein N-acetyltransferase